MCSILEELPGNHKHIENFLEKVLATM